MPIAWLARARDGGLFCIGETVLLATGLVLTRFAARAARPQRLTYGVLFVACAALAWGTGLFGSFVCVPGIAGLIAAMYGYGPDRRFRIAGAIGASTAVFGPFLLELTGVIERRYSFHDGAMTIRSGLLALTETEALCTLGLVTMLAAVLPAVLSGLVHRDIHAAVQHQELQAWHLGQLARARRG
jgi:hypothetical protein